MPIPISGVNTSIALFIGRTIWGPTNKPYLCFSYSNFERTFTSDTSQSDLARAIRLFFINGGTQCYVVRIYKGVESIATKNAQLAGSTFCIKAKFAGKLGNSINIDISDNIQEPGKKFDLKIYKKIKNSSGDIVQTDVELWSNLSMKDTDPRYYIKIVKSTLVDLIPKGNTFPSIRSYALSGGIESVVPDVSDYTKLFEIIEREVDLFNLLILPRDHGHNSNAVALQWGPASELCKRKKSFLLIDPPDGWATVQQAVKIGAGDGGINALKQNLVTDCCGVFYPNIKINENGTIVTVGPSGAIAGLMARIDSNRGVWKSSAGNDADIRGISDIEYKITDRENGLLNSHGINAIRVFPSGIVNWGSRTLDGDNTLASEWKYISVRRTAFFIEQSIYNGLKWVLHEPNDEPLWSQIRLTVGAFMHNLFRQGAFQGLTSKDAYFVKCDNETTTQNDINLGIVNIWIGFAPLKPSEFVILYFQQEAGQIQV